MNNCGHPAVGTLQFAQFYDKYSTRVQYFAKKITAYNIDYSRVRAFTVAQIMTIALS